MTIFHHSYLYFSVFLMLEMLILVSDLINCSLRKNFLLKLWCQEWRIKFYKVPLAMMLEDKDVKFSRVFPWGEGRIRLFPHFTDGGVKSLKDLLKKRGMT